MAKKRGGKAKLFFNTTPLTDTDYATATWNSGNLREVTLSVETGEADVTQRDDDWEQIIQSIKRGAVDLEMIWDTSNPLQVALRASWVSGDPIALAVMDADITGPAEGLASNFTVLNMERPEPLEDAMTGSFSVKPASFTDWWVKAS